MLRAADRLLKKSNQHPLAFRRTGNGEWGTVENPGQFAQPKTSDRIAGKELTEPKKQLLEGSGCSTSAPRLNRVLRRFLF
jgi:hypothetical protein